MNEVKPNENQNVETDFNERVEGFGKEFQKLLGKYEMAMKPHAVLLQNPQTGAYEIVPQIQLLSDRKKAEEKKEEASAKEEAKDSGIIKE